MKKISLSPKPKQQDLEEAQVRLRSLSGFNDNEFSTSVWRFSNSKGRDITINFDYLKVLYQKYPGWVEDRGVDLIKVTKLIWLRFAETTTVESYVKRFSGLGLLWTALAHYNLPRLTGKKDIADVLSFLLTHRWDQGRAINTVGLKSQANFFATLTFVTSTKPLLLLKKELMGQSLDWINCDVTNSSFKNGLKELIPELTNEDLTYREWLEGGSYNTLTLDYGRYYVEHCLTLYEQYIPLAIALSYTYQARSKIADSLGYSNNTVNNLLPRILKGHSVEDLQQAAERWGKVTIKRVHDTVMKYFKGAYQQSTFEGKIIQDSGVESFLNECGLQSSPVNIDRMRVIIWEWLQRKDEDETRLLLDECDIAVPWNTFIRKLGKFEEFYKQDVNVVPTLQDYKAVGLLEADSIRDVSKSFPRQLINIVEKAGLTSMVALTGWRKSEYGFPISAIKRTRNEDKLDEHAFPWRYQVDWYVHKTHGKVRQLREITFSAIVIAQRLKKLIGAEDDQPCLYSTPVRKRDKFDSEKKVMAAVTYPWKHYVKHYSGFKLMDDWQSWESLVRIEDAGSLLTTDQQNERKRLLKSRSSNEWNTLKIDVNLKEAWRRAREEWPRLEFFLLGSSTKEKKEWLIKYRNGTLRPKWTRLLDKYISEETRDHLFHLPDDDLNSRATSKAVSSELLSEALYPSPHAFRHIWAEAVYRRFDGDAGWMIRSQFKHISRAMWLAYIRDKDNRHGHQRVKTQVVSSLVHNYLKNKGEGYAGQLNTWLRRLLKKSSLLTPEEQRGFVEQLATVEIENIKANPWGYCLLKRRTRSKAKCAEMGEPMRHNASPDLCLGCAHNLMQTENVEWSLFHATSHVEALKNPIVPAIFKDSSYKLVKNVTEHVRTLNPQHEGLPELREVLEKYKISRTV